MSANDQSLDILMLVQKVNQLFGDIRDPLLPCDLGPNLEQLHKLLHPLSQARMPVPGDVGLEVHFVVLRVHHSKWIVLIFIVTKPRAVGKL